MEFREHLTDLENRPEGERGSPGEPTGRRRIECCAPGCYTSRHEDPSPDRSKEPRARPGRRRGHRPGSGQGWPRASAVHVQAVDPPEPIASGGRMEPHPGAGMGGNPSPLTRSGGGGVPPPSKQPVLRRPLASGALGDLSAVRT
jgi:hypothetical protein